MRMPGPQRTPGVAALPWDNTVFTHRAREELGCSSPTPLPPRRVSWKGTLRKGCPIQGSKPNTGPSASLHRYHRSPAQPHFISESSTRGVLQPLKQGPAQSWGKTGAALVGLREKYRPGAVGDSATADGNHHLQRWRGASTACPAAVCPAVYTRCSSPAEMCCAPPDQGTRLQMCLDPLVGSILSWQPVFHLLFCFALSYSQNGFSGHAKV